MNMLALSQVSMTSREIAELTGKRHADVLRDIRVLYDQLIADGAELRHEEIQQVTFETDARGYMALATMQKDFVLTLLTGYDAKARFRVVKRWQELENNTAILPQNYPAALRALADESERRALVERELEASRPKIAFHDQVVKAETLLDIAQVFSLLQGRTGQCFTRKTFLDFLRRHGIACQPNKHAGIGKNRFVPRKDFTGTWFVSELTDGGVEWFTRPLAVAGIVSLIEQDRMNPAHLCNAIAKT